jgi:hypothetical protein
MLQRDGHIVGVGGILNGGLWLIILCMCLGIVQSNIDRKSVV